MADRPAVLVIPPSPHPPPAALGLAGEITVPMVVAATGPEVANRFLEFFLVAIRNPHTRRAYAAAVRAFCAWLEARGAPDLTAVQPVHVATYVEALGRNHTRPSVALHLASRHGTCPKWSRGCLVRS